MLWTAGISLRLAWLGLCMDRRRPLVLAALLAAETAALACAVALGRAGPLVLPRTDLGGWLATSPPADVLMTLVRLLAVACSGWLLASTVLYMVSVVRQRPAGLVARLTLPVLRRIADRAVAAALVTSGVSGGAAWAETGREAAVVVPPGAHGVAEVSAPVSQSAAAAAGHDGRATWVISEGEHLWGIARALLERERGAGTEQPSDREVHARWVVLLRDNADRLSSGDPDMIHPGEVLVLPDPDGG